MVTSEKQLRKNAPSPDIVGALRDRVIGDSQVANRHIDPDRNCSFDNDVPFEFHTAPGVAYDEALPESDQPPQSYTQDNTKSISEVAASPNLPDLKSPVHQKRRPSVLTRVSHTVAYGFFAIALFGVLVLFLEEHLGPRADAARSSLPVEPSTAAIQAQETQLEHRFEDEVAAIRQIAQRLTARQDRLEQEFSQLQAAEQQEISQLKAAEQQELLQLQAEKQEISQLQAAETRRHRLYRR
jgi:hypothetical protein